MLPDPETYRKDTYEAAPEEWNNKYSITFHKVKFRTRSGKRFYRWTYEGKILVRKRSEWRD